ncbi:hypothetical protein Ocin01_09653 [Orchesella cincta]|uniref:Uncharacterized protein n=1 Tax=Orchesella cincta TaxID=48709 RepID=A0A1D2MVA0_ORCCI|nr:hypothetical protein Ocin01_09653 [Orchesella cincta]
MKDAAGSIVVVASAETKDNGEHNSDTTSANSSLGDSFRESAADGGGGVDWVGCKNIKP